VDELQDRIGKGRPVATSESQEEVHVKVQLSVFVAFAVAVALASAAAAGPDAAKHRVTVTKRAPKTASVASFAPLPHVQTGFYPVEGKRGDFTARILFKRDAEGDRSRGWRVLPSATAPASPSSGQYVHVTAQGRIVRIGGKAQGWSARLEGFMSRPGEAKQRVVITMKGRPEGVFVLTPGS
jgi:hypothetical protein